MNKFAIIVILSSMMVMGSFAAPIKNDFTTQNAATTSSPTVTIPELLATAQLQVLHTEQSVFDLEREMNETFNMTRTNCYVRHSTNKIDINTIKEDVTSLTQLLPVIQELADNETDEVIAEFYNKTIKLMENSIAVLNNLTNAFDNKETATAPPSDKEEGTTDDDKASDNPQPTDQPMDEQQPDKEMETGSDKLDGDHRCDQLDKLLKLGALKLQVLLTAEAIAGFQID